MNIVKSLKITLAAATLFAVTACTASAPKTGSESAQSVIQPPVSVESSEAAENTPTPAATPTPTPVANPSSEGYKLGNGDTLRVTVFGEPELSGEFQVDGTGMISMPLIGEINASGQSVRQVQRAMENLFKDGYLNNPRISAEVVNFRPFYILGEVSRPGEYPYTDGLTVLNAIATAQGYTYRANKKVIFVRGADEKEERQVRLTSTTPVNPGDTLRIGERLF